MVYEKIAITASGTAKADQKSINPWSRMISFGRLEASSDYHTNARRRTQPKTQTRSGRRHVILEYGDEFVLLKLRLCSMLVLR